MVAIDVGRKERSTGGQVGESADRGRRGGVARSCNKVRRRTDEDGELAGVARRTASTA